jgi:DNA-binding transcriptional MerR regulator
MQQSTILPLAPIPARVVPYPWEDLASYITRVAAEMGYKNPGWILHPEGVVSTVQPYNLCRLRRKTDYQFLEQLLCLNEVTIYDLTLHRFTLCLLESEVSRQVIPDEIQRPLLTQYMFQTFFHPYSATKVCSVCLTEEPLHGRLYWSALPVVACLRHRVFLTNRCPACQCPIPLLRPSLSNCPRCHKGDYREASIVHMPEDPLFSMGQDLILLNLGVQCTIQNIGVTDTSRTPLLQLLPWQYFLLLDAFRCILGPLFPDAPFLQVGADTRVLLRRRPRPQSALSLLEWSVIISTVHSLCTSWPDNFLSFLDALPPARSERRRKRDRQRATGLQRDFGVFYEKWLYQRLAHPAFAFLHEAFESYLEKHYTGGEVTKRLQPFKGRSRERLQERPYLTKAQTKAIMGIGEDVLQALLVQGSLRCLKKPIGREGKRTMFLIERGSVETLQREWAGLLPLDTVARSYLGATKGVLLMLEQARLLVPARGPFVDGYKFRLYRAPDVDRFIMQFLDRAVKVSNLSSELLPLCQAASMMGIALVTVLDSMLKGDLTLFDLDHSQPLLRRLALSRDGIQNYLDERKRRRQEVLGLLTVHEAAAWLSVDDKVLQRWIRQGLLTCEQDNGKGNKSRLLIRREMLDIFRKTYLFTEEVAKCLGVTPSTVHKYVRKGIIYPVAGRRIGDGSNRLLFLRKEVEALLPDEGLTVREAAQALEVRPARVYALLKSGSLTRIAGLPGTSTSIRICHSDLEVYRHDAKSKIQLTRTNVITNMEEYDEQDER